MTVTLAYDNANAKVSISANALAGADTATVERSTNQVGWTTVRGGTAVALSGGSMALPGTAGNYASTPDNAALDILGDIDLRGDLVMTDWTPVGNSTIVSKRGAAGQRSYLFQVQTSGQLSLNWSNDGTTQITDLSTVAPTVADGQRLAVRVTLDVDNGAAGHTTTFYTAPTIDGPWTVLGAPVVTAGTTSIFNSTAAAEVGSFNGGLSDLLAGTIHSVEVRNGIDGTVVAAPFFKGQPAGTTSFTDWPGRVWTLNGTASISTRQFVTALDDYEFTPGVTNFYRVRGVEAGPITYLGVGAAATANNASVTPALPTGLIAGDLMVAFVSIRNTPAGGTINTPTGWTIIRTMSNVVLYGRKFVVGDAAPTFTFNNGVLNADTIGQIAAWRRSDVTALTGADQFNSVAVQNIAFPGLTITADGCLVIVAGWKQDDWTSVATLGGLIEIAEAVAIAGDDAGQVWDYAIQTTRANLTASSFVVTGGGVANSRGFAVAMPHATFLNEQILSTVPTLDRVWLKSLVRPFLNRPVTVVGFTDPGRPARSDEFPVVGRTLPVGINDLRSSRRWTVQLYTATAADAQTLDFILSAGDTMLLHVPLTCDVPGGYVAIKDTSQRHPDGRVRGARRITTLPLVEVAAPGPDVAGNISTWASVLAAYATWDAVLLAFPTWADLLALHGVPSEVIVG